MPTAEPSQLANSVNVAFSADERKFVWQGMKTELNHPDVERIKQKETNDNQCHYNEAVGGQVYQFH